MAKKSDAFGKFVRLNLIGEIFEVVGFDSIEITVNYHGHNLTMEHYEVSRVTPEEAAAAASQVDKPKSEKLKDAGTVGERVFIFQRDKSNGSAAADE